MAGCTAAQRMHCFLKYGSWYYLYNKRRLADVTRSRVVAVTTKQRSLEAVIRLFLPAGVRTS